MTFIRNTAPETEADVRAIVECLLKAPVGEIATHEAINASVGRDVRASAPWLVQRALNRAAQQHGAVFANVRGVGYRRLPPEAAPDLGAHARRRVRRTCRTAIRRMEAAISGANDLPADVVARVNRERAQIGLLAHLSTDRAAKNVPSGPERPATLAHTLEGLRRYIGVPSTTEVAE